jgi:hypothetical protein
MILTELPGTGMKNIVCLSIMSFVCKFNGQTKKEFVNTVKKNQNAVHREQLWQKDPTLAGINSRI